MQLKAELEDLKSLIKEYFKVVSDLNKYKGNQHYKLKKKEAFIKINGLIKRLNQQVSEVKSFEKLKEKILIFIDEKTEYKQKVDLFDEIELNFQDVFLESDSVQTFDSKHTIPSEIPFTPVRLDLEEAIRDATNGCYLSSLVMCRRAYEGALIEKYKETEKSDPLKQIACKNCKNVVRANVFMSITELHKWAVDTKVISDKFRDVGFLVPNLGSGGAHPTEDFPRDQEVANIVVSTTLSLLKQVYSR